MEKLIVKALPINYMIKLNGEKIGEGHADFGELNE